MRYFHFLALSFGCAGLLRAHPGHDDSPGTSSTALPPPEVSITEEGSMRIIKSNGLPDHSTGQFPGRGNPNTIGPQHYEFRMPLKPVANRTFATPRHQPVGVAVNGVVFDPGTAEFWNNDPQSGWHMEAIGGPRNLGLDQNHAHVQPSGAYHYHGLPTGLLAQLGTNADRMLLIGWAADGFPIYNVSAHEKANDSSSPLRPMKPSYRLKSGQRPGGTSGPGGAYDGSYTEDYEYVAGLGDLDEANGRTGVTPEYPKGTYYYVATETFPYLLRMFKGTPDPSFARRGPGGRQGPGGGMHRPPGGPGGFGQPPGRP